MQQVSTVMARPVLAVHPGVPLGELLSRMQSEEVAAAVVLEHGVPLGTLSEPDAAGAALDQPGLRVSDAMRPLLGTIDASADLSAALRMLSGPGSGHLAVTSGGEVVGVVSLSDLAPVLSIGPVPTPPGLKGVVVADTELSDVRGEEGFYHYRQYSAVELAERRTLEDSWRLLLDGELPHDRAEREAFAAEVRPLRSVSPLVMRTLPAIAGPSEPLEGLRTAISLAASERGLRPLYDIAPAARREDALFVAAVTPTLLAALHRLRRGKEPVPPRPELEAGANYLWMLSGVEPDPVHAGAIERYLISTIDHGFNASTFTARVIASTGADLGACLVGAIGALSGPLHGGAPSRALELLDEIGSPERARSVIESKVRRGERIMGFGHAVYRTEDPRSNMLREVARQLGGPLADLALKVERTVVEVLAELKPGRLLYANVEFYAGVVMAACGIPP
ncbi:MAG: citrate/2-methylcitrate synthase, partial [Candidatus Dormibacteria bacterium]